MPKSCRWSIRSAPPPHEERCRPPGRLRRSGRTNGWWPGPESIRTPVPCHLSRVAGGKGDEENGERNPTWLRFVFPGHDLTVLRSSCDGRKTSDSGGTTCWASTCDCEPWRPTGTAVPQPL